MRRSIFLVPLLILAACGDDAADILDPVVSNALVAGPTAVVTVDGMQYQIGCPDYPCPVTQMVLDHIAQRKWFWMPAGTLTKPAIYLYQLEVLVKLSAVTPPTIVLPPQTPPAPELTGPTVVQGFPIGGMAQIMCGNVPYSLNVPDQGTWDFSEGEVYYEYVKWDAGQATWVKTGQSSIVPLTDASWAQVVAGTFVLLPPVGGHPYYATVSAELVRGTYTALVSHRLLCAGQIPAPVNPPVPSLDGPTDIHSSRTPKGYLACTAVGATLISPDGGAWNFVSGHRYLEFISLNPATKTFYLNGNTRTDPLSSADWQNLLAGTHSIDLGVPTLSYRMTFTVTVERGPDQHTLTHQALCGHEAFFDMPHPGVQNSN